jgi:hypothetical protein
LAQVDATPQEKQNIIGVRLWTREESLAYHEAQKERVITNHVNDAVAVDEQTE